jgi:hypothetical protein|tara:strand:- start:716 stop:1300 length:585 start_codon:yes stop_codon:yes gene_type:complete
MSFCGKESENGYDCFKKGVGVGLGLYKKKQKKTKPNHANHFTTEDVSEETPQKYIDQFKEAEKMLNIQKEKQKEKAKKRLEERLKKRNKSLQIESDVMELLSKPMKKIDILNLLDNTINELYRLYDLETSDIIKKKIDVTSDGFEELYDSINQHQSDDSELLTIIKNKSIDRVLYGYEDIDKALSELELWFESK